MGGLFPAHFQDQDGARILVLLPSGPLDLDVIDVGLAGVDDLRDGVEVLQGIELHEDRDVAQPPLEGGLKRPHHIQDQDQDDQDHGDAIVEARAGGHAHADRGEEARGRGQARDLLVADGDDGPGSQKAHAADDLGGVAGAVKLEADLFDDRGPGPAEHLVLIGRQKHGQGGADAGQDEGPQPRGPLLSGAAVTDDGARQKGQQETEDDRTEVEILQVEQHILHFYSPKMNSVSVWTVSEKGNGIKGPQFKPCSDGET